MELPAGTVSLLFTDIEGSTRLLGEFGDAYADLLAEHRRLLVGIVPSWRRCALGALGLCQAVCAALHRRINGEGLDEDGPLGSGVSLTCVRGP